jgi:hypothetical protein
VVFWDVVPNNVVDWSQSFGEICSVHLQGRGGNVGSASNMVTQKYQTRHHHIPKKKSYYSPPSEPEIPGGYSQKKKLRISSKSFITDICFIFSDVNNTTVYICVLYKEINLYS